MALGAAGASALAFGGYAASAFGQAADVAITYRGSRIVVQRRHGRPELYIGGEHVLTVHNNGSYRAATYAFDWSDSLEELGKKMVDYRRALAARG